MRETWCPNNIFCMFREKKDFCNNNRFYNTKPSVWNRTDKKAYPNSQRILSSSSSELKTLNRPPWRRKLMLLLTSANTVLANMFERFAQARQHSSIVAGKQICENIPLQEVFLKIPSHCIVLQAVSRIKVYIYFTLLLLLLLLLLT